MSFLWHPFPTSAPDMTGYPGGGRRGRRLVAGIWAVWAEYSLIGWPPQSESELHFAFKVKLKLKYIFAKKHANTCLVFVLACVHILKKNLGFQLPMYCVIVLIWCVIWLVKTWQLTHSGLMLLAISLAASVSLALPMLPHYCKLRMACWGNRTTHYNRALEREAANAN